MDNDWQYVLLWWKGIILFYCFHQFSLWLLYMIFITDNRFIPLYLILPNHLTFVCWFHKQHFCEKLYVFCAVFIECLTAFLLHFFHLDVNVQSIMRFQTHYINCILVCGIFGTFVLKLRKLWIWCCFLPFFHRLLYSSWKSPGKMHVQNDTHYNKKKKRSKNTTKNAIKNKLPLKKCCFFKMHCFMPFKTPSKNTMCSNPFAPF